MERMRQEILMVNASHRGSQFCTIHYELLFLVALTGSVIVKVSVKVRDINYTHLTCRNIRVGIAIGPRGERLRNGCLNNQDQQISI